MEQCKPVDDNDIKKIAYLSINDKDFADEIEINLGNDYEYKFEMNRLYILKKKLEYPKTYKECCDVLLIPPYYNLRYHTYEPAYDEYTTSNTLLSLENKLNTLGKLIICRNAYWKIASEELGLGKPWEPDWKNGTETKYTIVYSCSMILNGTTNLENKILAFPTKEMRDVFYENFKELINECKELL